MYNVLDAQSVREAEQKIIESGVDVFALRYNAALAVADAISDRAAARNAFTAVFCGAGGNGYDGILAAGRLKKQGCNVALYSVGERKSFPPAAIKLAESFGLKCLPSAEYNGGATVIVDAIFGIGLNREVTGEAFDIIDKLNAESGFKLAVDIPSGIDADSGKVLGTAFKADVTVTFSCYKTGQLFGGRDYCGKIIVADVGIPTDSIVKVYDDGDFKPYSRKKTAHKGTAGRIFVIGGSGNMVGAPMLAGAAAHTAYLNGAGTVTVCLPSIHRVAAASRAAMSMMRFLPDTKDGFIKFDKPALDDIISKATAIDIGMGMGKTPELKDIVKYICANFGGTLVIDADALNAISGDYAFIKDGKAKVVLTPHVGEFERLTGKPASIENAVELASRTKSVVVLKSDVTIVTDGKQIRLNTAGTPAMAKGGMGDVLGGCITALACTFKPIDAACIACYRNGLGAENAVRSYAELMLTAKDVLKFADYDEI